MDGISSAISRKMVRLRPTNRVKFSRAFCARDFYANEQFVADQRTLNAVVSNFRDRGEYRDRFDVTWRTFETLEGDPKIVSKLSKTVS